MPSPQPKPIRLEIAACNVARAFSDPERSDRVLSGLREIPADLLFISEAFDNKHGHNRLEHMRVARALGGTALCTEYADAEPHPSGEQYMMGFMRRMPKGTTIDMHSRRLATRNAIEARIKFDGGEAKVVHVHNDDRNETVRQDMMESLVDASDPRRTRIATIGDHNMTHGDDRWPKIMRHPVIGGLISWIPHERTHSLASRLHQMTYGKVMRYMEGAGFTSVDELRRPTKGPFQLDHLMIAEHDGIAVESDSFEVYDIDGTDHRAIGATLLLYA